MSDERNGHSVVDGLPQTIIIMDRHEVHWFVKNGKENYSDAVVGTS